MTSGNRGFLLQQSELYTPAVWTAVLLSLLTGGAAAYFTGKSLYEVEGGSNFFFNDDASVLPRAFTFMWGVVFPSAMSLVAANVVAGLAVLGAAEGALRARNAVASLFSSTTMHSLTLQEHNYQPITPVVNA